VLDAPELIEVALSESRSYTLKELRVMCTARGLQSTGRKAELAERLGLQGGAN
jgi:hypothetical protein